MTLIQRKKQQLKYLQTTITRVQKEIEHLRKRKSTVRLRKVAVMLGVSGKTVWRMVMDGRLKGYQRCPRGWWLISKRSLMKLERDILNGSKTIRFH